jgi:4'-phosphopantetheinyl transferase
MTANLELDVLSPDELARAGRYHFERDRDHFSRCRSTLRALLAVYLTIPAGEIRFDYSASGKPHLAAEQNRRALQFNVSHSGNMALIAFGNERHLGVDIERIRADVDTTALAERFFSARERAGLHTLPDHLRVPAFYACWTRKEAFLKATGDGLSFPLADFSVATNPDLDPKLEEIKGDTEAAKNWFLADISVIEGYRAALASDGSYSDMETYAWN